MFQWIKNLFVKKTQLPTLSFSFDANAEMLYIKFECPKYTNLTLMSEKYPTVLALLETGKLHYLISHSLKDYAIRHNREDFINNIVKKTDELLNVSILAQQNNMLDEPSMYAHEVFQHNDG